MKIYVGRSSAMDFRNGLYGPIRGSELDEEHEAVLPHEDSDDLFDSREFLREECDLFVAEVSEAIPILVGLVGVRHVRTVVLAVGNAVPVAVLHGRHPVVLGAAGGDAGRLVLIGGLALEQRVGPVGGGLLELLEGDGAVFVILCVALDTDAPAVSADVDLAAALGAVGTGDAVDDRLVAVQRFAAPHHQVDRRGVALEDGPVGVVGLGAVGVGLARPTIRELDVDLDPKTGDEIGRLYESFDAVRTALKARFDPVVEEFADVLREGDQPFPSR
jgi:hypothetical protein